MRRLPLVPNETAALARAETWVAALDDAYGRAGIDAKHPAAEPLIAMDRDLRVWERAVAAGHHTPASVGAAARVLHWLGELDGMQKRADKRRRPVTRSLAL
jgi:hypothetical protein